MVGAERPFSWFKYFHKFGLYPIVITRHWNHKVNHISEASFVDNSPLKIEKSEFGEVHYLPYKGTLRDRVLSHFGANKFVLLRRILTLIELFAEYLSIHFSAYKSFYKYADRLIEQQKPYVILISANPFSQFRIGYLLNKKYGLPWVADYRDDWTTNQLNDRSGIIKKLLLPLERYCERKWVKSAKHFFSVTPVYTKRIEQLTGVGGTNIYNGYDVNYKSTSDDKSDVFTLLYTGSVYHQQDFSLLADAIEILIERDVVQSEKIEVHFLGATMNFLMPENVKVLSDKLGLIGVKCILLPHAIGDEFATHLANASMLFFSRYGSLKGIVPAKIFTYLGSKKPILLVGSDGDTIEHLLKPYSVGFVANTAIEVASAIEKIYLNQEVSISKEDDTYVSQFSRFKLASLAADILHKVLAK